jgi:arginine decarboxylase-like protein
VQQLFPILPIHGLREEPRRRGILADITCDSDGKVDKFIDMRDVKKTLELHDYDGGDYYLAAFLVGAYQEILGDLHNLFGDTNSVHVSLDENGNINVDTVVKGDTVQQVLSYVQYSGSELTGKMRKDVEDALREKRITLEEAARFLKFYEQGMGAYTYLTSRPQPALQAPALPAAVATVGSMAGAGTGAPATSNGGGISTTSPPTPITAAPGEAENAGRVAESQPGVALS